MSRLILRFLEKIENVNNFRDMCEERRIIKNDVE